jgi:hypothetical protein
MNQDPLHLFAENLITEAGLKLSEDFKLQYLEKLKEQINRRITLTLMDKLKEEDVEKFSELMSAEPQPDINVVQAFYKERIPNLEVEIQEALIQFSSEFISAAKK